jgi:exonuclease III
VPPETMKILSWNCRGIGNPAIVKELHDLAKNYAPSVLFIMETQINKHRVENLRYSLGFDDSFAINISGRSGGLGLF